MNSEQESQRAQEQMNPTDPVSNEAASSARSLSLPVPLVAGGLFGVLLLAGIYWAATRPPPAPPPAPSEESRAYLPSVTVSDFRLSIADNMVGSVILYLDGMVNNKGDRTVRYLRVRLYFYDSLSQLILRVERDVISPRAKPLAPGETREFQLRFDRPPASWNLQPPQFQLVSLEIE